MTTAYFIGDSVTQHFDATACTRLGWTLTEDSVGASGFLANGLGTNFNTRLAALIAAAPPIVVVQGGFNDRYTATTNLASVVTAIDSFFSGLSAGLPSALVYVCAPWYPAGSDGTAPYESVGNKAAVLSIATEVRGQAAKYNYVYIDWITVPWMTGTGKVGTPVGDGNRDVYTSSDGIHPSTPAGDAYLGTRFAFAIKAPSTGLDF